MALDKIFNFGKKKSMKIQPDQHIGSAYNMNGEVLNIIEKTKMLQVVDSPKTNVFADLSELKQTCEQLKQVLTPWLKTPPPVTNVKAVEVSIVTLSDVRKQLLSLEGSVPLDFWNKSKVTLYQLDFLLKIQTDQLGVLIANGPTELLVAQDAKQFWLDSFTDKAYFVPWPEFFAKLAEGTQEEISRDEKAIKMFLDFCRDEQVSPYEFEVFLKWFGPLKGCCGRLLDAVRAGLLAGFMPAMEANALLENKVAGSFLIRFSKTRPGSFAVTFVDYTKQIKHVLLYSVEPFGVTLKTPPKVYDSLKDFASAHSSKLKFPVGVRVMWELASEASSSQAIAAKPAAQHSPGAQAAAVPVSSSPPPSNPNIVTTRPNRAAAVGPNEFATHGPNKLASGADSGLYSDVADEGNLGGSHANGGGLSSSGQLDKHEAVKVASSVDPVKGDICVICLDAKRSTVFLECGHMVCCNECSKMITDCPICRQKIARVIPVFKS